jgi:hypothetical protein
VRGGYSWCNGEVGDSANGRVVGHATAGFIGVCAPQPAGPVVNRFQLEPPTPRLHISNFEFLSCGRLVTPLPQTGEPDPAFGCYAGTGAEELGPHVVRRAIPVGPSDDRAMHVAHGHHRRLLYRAVGGFRATTPMLLGDWCSRVT